MRETPRTAILDFICISKREIPFYFFRFPARNFHHQHPDWVSLSHSLMNCSAFADLTFFFFFFSFLKSIYFHISERAYRWTNARSSSTIRCEIHEETCCSWRADSHFWPSDFWRRRGILQQRERHWKSTNSCGWRLMSFIYIYIYIYIYSSWSWFHYVTKITIPTFFFFFFFASA